LGCSVGLCIRKVLWGLSWKNASYVDGDINDESCSGDRYSGNVLSRISLYLTFRKEFGTGGIQCAQNVTKFNEFNLQLSSFIVSGKKSVLFDSGYKFKVSTF
jgi:hypothetical protein